MRCSTMTQRMRQTPVLQESKLTLMLVSISKEKMKLSRLLYGHITKKDQLSERFRPASFRILEKK